MKAHHQRGFGPERVSLRRSIDQELLHRHFRMTFGELHSGSDNRDQDGVASGRLCMTVEWSYERHEDDERMSIAPE